jgi:hypothetical protein
MEKPSRMTSPNSMDRQKESVQTCLVGGFNFNHLEKYESQWEG